MTISINRINAKNWNMAYALGIRKLTKTQRAKLAVASAAKGSITFVKGIEVKKQVSKLAKLKHLRLKNINPFYIKGE